DEAHHAPATSWSRVMGHFRPRLLLGCTATPLRLDGKDLAEWFGPPLFSRGLDGAIDDGYLVPVRQHAVLTGVGLDGVRRSKSKGDFVLKALARAVPAGAGPHHHTFDSSPGSAERVRRWRWIA